MKIYSVDLPIVQVGIFHQAHLQLRSAGGPDVSQQPGGEKGPERIVGQRALDGFSRLHQLHPVRRGGGGGGIIDVVVGTRPNRATLAAPATAAATISERR